MAAVISLYRNNQRHFLYTGIGTTLISDYTLVVKSRLETISHTHTYRVTLEGGC